ncbi:hypothetical protein NZ47_04340 [Anaerovibrio lipolyticus]|uniref:Uncharacterized protein n=1 Tax=Anaerovibrio lipolyticus TaxID=82374 RepID=A0A0B2K2Z8_9FIRM|nr:hypothetical protein NZ47_04340 [Anaerovibrio lipolyticus]
MTGQRDFLCIFGGAWHGIGGALSHATRYNRNISMLILKLINDIISVRKETADGVSQLPRSIL